ncbi:hypothetical protein Tco_0542078, partial [Tanacetum coccineum]
MQGLSVSCQYGPLPVNSFTIISLEYMFKEQEQSDMENMYDYDQKVVSRWHKRRLLFLPILHILVSEKSKSVKGTLDTVLEGETTESQKNVMSGLDQQVFYGSYAVYGYSDNKKGEDNAHRKRRQSFGTARQGYVIDAIPSYHGSVSPALNELCLGLKPEEMAPKGGVYAKDVHVRMACLNTAKCIPPISTHYVPQEAEVAEDLWDHYDYVLRSDYSGLFKALSHVNYNVRMAAAGALAAV